MTIEEKARAYIQHEVLWRLDEADEDTNFIISLVEDAYKEGYTQALKDNPILQDINEGKVLIVDKGWLAEHDRQMIDKACEWLQEHLFCTVKTDVDNIIDVCSRDVFLDNFKKAME